MDLMGKGDRSGDDHKGEAGSELPTDIVNRRTAGIFGWIIGFFVAIWLFGFSIGGPLCTFIQLKIGYRERWPLTLILAGFSWVFIYGLFDRILHVPFPEGQIFLWLKFSSV
jgi:hypothetical protein